VQLTLQEMEGMWILVAALIGLAVVLTLLPKINRNWDVDKLHAGTASSGSRSSLGRAASVMGVDFSAPSITGSEAGFGHSQRQESSTGAGPQLQSTEGIDRKLWWGTSSAGGASSPHSHAIKQAEMSGMGARTVTFEIAAMATVV